MANHKKQSSYTTRPHPAKECGINVQVPSHLSVCKKAFLKFPLHLLHKQSSAPISLFLQKKKSIPPKDTPPRTPSSSSHNGRAQNLTHSLSISDRHRLIHKHSKMHRFPHIICRNLPGSPPRPPTADKN